MPPKTIVLPSALLYRRNEHEDGGAEQGWAARNARSPVHWQSACACCKFVFAGLHGASNRARSRAG